MWASRQYLGHVWGQLGPNEANVVVYRGVDAWYHHRPRRRLTRDGWVMAHVAVVPCLFHIAGPRDTRDGDISKHFK